MIGVAAVVSLLTVGPAFAGDSVMWGEVGPTGALRVMQAAPGSDPVLVHRVAPDQSTGVVALEASGERFAVSVSRARRSGDTLTIGVRAWGGPFSGPVEALGCFSVGGIAVDGARMAVAGGCGVAVDGAKIPAQGVRHLSLAGEYVAWASDEEVVVHDLAAGATVLRLTRRDLGAAFVDEVAVQPDGAVAFSYGSERRQRLAWAAPGMPGARVLDTAAMFDGLRAAGGRVLYERRTGPRHQRRVLLLRSPAGGTARRLARFTDRRSRAGDLDLDAGRAAWGVRPAGRSMRIVVREL